MSLEPIFMPTDTKRPHITVRPEKQEPNEPSFQPRKAFQKATLGDGKSFSGDDFIDLINPLHHIPIVGQVYRALTGDSISKEASVVGGTLFGGPIGLAAASINALVQHEAAAPAIKAQQTALKQPEQKPVELAQMVRRPIITPPSVTPPPPQTHSFLGDEPDVIEQAYKGTDAPKVVKPADALPSSLPPEELQKHDTILELFGSGLSSMGSEYIKAQQLTYAQEAQKQLRV